MVISEPDRARVLRAMDAHEASVDAFEVNLTVLDSQAGFKDIFSSTKRPCIAVNRRGRFMKFYGFSDVPSVSEEERVRRLRMAAGAGASAVDCELDIFDEARQKTKPPYLSGEEAAYAARTESCPTELSRDRRVAAKQRQFVREIRGGGVEVVFSCHTQTVMRRAHAVGIISTMQSRGADFAKIVSMTLSQRDLTSFVESVVALSERARIPFNLMNVGSESVLGRLLSVKLGSSWVYCRPDTGAVYSGQPTVRQARAFFGAVGLSSGR
jgi:3-dehydroquinate dehydratase